MLGLSSLSLQFFLLGEDKDSLALAFRESVDGAGFRFAVVVVVVRTIAVGVASGTVRQLP